jgi:hypothetical protein
MKLGLRYGVARSSRGILWTIRRFWAKEMVMRKIPIDMIDDGLNGPNIVVPKRLPLQLMRKQQH